MKIAVVTDDSKIISAHFGRAQFYDVFTISNNQIVARETRSKANHNHFTQEYHEHSHGLGYGTDPASKHRHNAMIEAINDCQFLLAHGMGMGAHQSPAASGIRPIITDTEIIEEALDQFLSGELTDHPEKLH